MPRRPGVVHVLSACSHRRGVLDWRHRLRYAEVSRINQGRLCLGASGHGALGRLSAPPLLSALLPRQLCGMVCASGRPVEARTGRAGRTEFQVECLCPPTSIQLGIVHTKRPTLLVRASGGHPLAPNRPELQDFPGISGFGPYVVRPWPMSCACGLMSAAILAKLGKRRLSLSARAPLAGAIS